jgi:hypothetical protein
VIESVSIGDSYKGGKIAYIFQPGDPGYIYGQIHGLIAAVSDPVSGVEWCSSDSYVTTGAIATSLGTGSANTTTIISYQGDTETSYAAKICKDYSYGGYNDWFLPSKDELNKLYLSKNLIGGFANSYYWSSTEYSNPYAWLQDFQSGSQSYFIKGVGYEVRPVRTF